MNKFPIILFFLPCLFSCSNKPINAQDFSGKISDSFTTSIADNGLKLFTYRVFFPSIDNHSSTRLDGLMKKNSKSNTQLPSKIRRKQNETSLELLTQQTELGLQKTLEMTRFCRTGYIELYRLIENERGMIRGECLEGANLLDKQTFGSEEASI
ncbi:hypothetical protein [uncultured Shewanella sp.]|uniref:hypothetical protein n=1 Tax=uncultured Shewanella sp. TaxID=173975 RepID=UPI002606C39E|nr:hypothetical protein [uncultured Shewanella sp.]